MATIKEKLEAAVTAYNEAVQQEREAEELLKQRRDARIGKLGRVEALNELWEEELAAQSRALAEVTTDDAAETDAQPRAVE